MLLAHNGSVAKSHRTKIPIFAIPLIAIALIFSAPAFAQEPPALKLSRGQLEAGEAENVPELRVTQGIGLVLNLVSLDDQIEDVKSADDFQVLAERLGDRAIELNPAKKAELGRQSGLTIAMRSGRIFRFLVLVQKEPAPYSVIDILPSGDQPVIAAAAQQVVLDPAPAPGSELLPVPSVEVPTAQGGPVELPPPPLAEGVDIPVPAPQLVAVAARSEEANGSRLAEMISAGLPIALEEGKIKPYSEDFNKVQKAIASLRFGQTTTLKQAAKAVRLKASVLAQLHQWGTR